MNLSEDPSDRLIDSLLREQRRGHPDEALLREINRGLDVAKTQMLHPGSARKRNYVAAAAVLAFLCLIGLSWSAIQRAIEKSRGFEAARKVEQERHAGVLKRERQDLEAKIQTAKEGPSLSPRDDKQVLSNREAVEEPVVPQPAETVDSEEEGLNLRFVAVEKEESPGAIFAHDPDGKTGEPGRLIEPRAYLADTGRINFKGSKIVLTSSKDPESLTNPSSVLASSYVGQSSGRGVMLLLPGTGKRGDPPAQLLFVDDRFSEFPAGSTLLVNASTKDIRFILEKDQLDCPSGEQVIIKDPPVNKIGMTPVRGLFRKDEEWRIFFSALWPQPGPNGRALQVCFDGRSPEVMIMGIRENLAVTHASDKTSPAEAVAKEDKDDGKPEVVVNGEVARAAEDPGKDLARLAFVGSAATKWYVQFGFESEGKWSPRLTGMTSLGKRLQNRISALKMLAPGSVFFEDGDMAGCFKFNAIVEREIVDARTGLKRTAKIAQYEDLRPGFRGRFYESISGLPEADLEKAAYQDPAAAFEFFPEGGGKGRFEVQLGERFSLPPGIAQPRYLLKSMDARSVTLEYKDQSGQTKTSTLSLK
ncbi:Amuc_1099 family pilus-like system protein [Luteolibacter luteus]|uniref:Uncharacterized protein n=1 Tax=Luteolibacter luteus TaxID=2728835 RepID=A0A858RQB7_9BACT|nr:Amuc_1099 family pilus-like system protein [Luteolibacter luteus]QJE98320.1 hypothetical protein HHL09_21895 [Luteolibacter luteus]